MKLLGMIAQQYETSAHFKIYNFMLYSDIFPLQFSPHVTTLEFTSINYLIHSYHPGFLLFYPQFTLIINLKKRY